MQLTHEDRAKLARVASEATRRIDTGGFADAAKAGALRCSPHDGLSAVWSWDDRTWVPRKPS